MILDKIGNSWQYENISPRIKKAFDYIKNTDFNTLELGKHTVEEGTLFAIFMEYDTKSQEECKLEAHRKFIDVQYIVSGSEYMGICPMGNQKVTRDYNPEDDYALFEGSPSFFKIEGGQFTVFFPEDLHMPNVKVEVPSKVKKVVMKVLID